MAYMKLPQRIAFRPVVVAAMAAFAAGCAKEDRQMPGPAPAPAHAVLALEHQVDGQDFRYDTVQYTNEAGQVYGITHLEYYLSQLTLAGAAGTPDQVIPGPWYVNGMNANRFDLGPLPAGTYTGATVQLGLSPALNQTGALPGTLENLLMAWPAPMGGGYHFMKFEGHFLLNGQPTGFAMHLGRDENLVHCTMQQPFTLAGAKDTLVLRFNLNEVFRSPHTYDLATGNQSMGSMALMGLLRDNCADAFTLEHRP